MNNHCLKKLVTITLVSISLVACNNGNKTSSVQPQISPLQQYINSLTYTPANSNHLLTGGTNQQSFITPGGITINSIDIKFYSDIDCTGNLIYTNTLNGGGAENPVIPPDGTYTSTNASNNALCYNYANSTTRKTHCTGLYEDMSAGNMRSLQYTYNTNNGSIIGQCMYNPAATVGSITGVEGIANWTTPANNAACSGGICGFSQNYDVFLGKRIFVTNTTTSGNIVGTSGKTAAAAADAICNSDSARPNSSAYKALLVTSTRYNDANGISSDWPLTAGTSYYNMVGDLSFTALGNGLPPNTFSNVIDPSSAYTVWTGAGIIDDAAVSWTQPADVGEICSDWTGDGTNMTNSAIAGAPQNNNSATWNYNGGSGSTCTDNIPLYCVQQ